MANILNIHVKILTEPTKFTVEQMVRATTRMYDTIGVTVRLVSTETLDIGQPELAYLNTIDTGGCKLSGRPAEEVIALSDFRNDADSKDIVLYICRTVKSDDGPLKGCGGAWPAGRPMAVIAKSAFRFTMAHEIGHVLGLKHKDNDLRLMTGNGTDIFNNPPPEPTFGEGEIETILESDLIR